MMDLHSDKIPNINYSPDITNLFDFFAFNWITLSPVVFLLIGIGLGVYLIRKIKDM